MKDRSFVPCAGKVAGVDPGRVGPWLERMGVERLERMTEAVEALYHQLHRDPAETMYHTLARAFGLKVNAEPFGMLAHALPLRTLQRYRDEELRTEALLFGQAGLLQIDFIDDHPRRLQEEHRVLSKLHALRPAPVAAWKFGRMRPVNFPTIRLAQFAQLLMRCDGSFGALLNAEHVSELRAPFDVQASAYWTDHFQFDRVSKAQSKRLGRTGADHLIINAVVPTLFALGRLQGRPELAERAMALLEELPAEKNQLLSSWEKVGLKADTAARGQALLELRHSYCGQRRCLSCVIGVELLKGSIIEP